MCDAETLRQQTLVITSAKRHTVCAVFQMLSYVKTLTHCHNLCRKIQMKLTTEYHHGVK